MTMSTILFSNSCKKGSTTTQPLPYPSLPPYPALPYSSLYRTPTNLIVVAGPLWSLALSSPEEPAIGGGGGIL